MLFSFQTQFWTTQKPGELFVSGGEPSELWQVNSIIAGLPDSPTVDTNAEESSLNGDESEGTAELVAVAAPRRARRYRQSVTTSR